MAISDDSEGEKDGGDSYGGILVDYDMLGSG